MSVQSKLARWYLQLRYGQSKTPKVLLALVVCAITGKIISQVFLNRGCPKVEHVKKSKRKNAINPEFFKQFQYLLKIMIPKFFCRETGIIGIHSFVLISRTFLSIYVAALEGRMIKAIVQTNVSQFTWLMCKWIMVAVPATLVNSLIRFFDSYIGLVLRERLSKHAYKLYFENDVYYKVSNVDTRLLNVDQCLTEDISMFSSQVAHLYSQITKPLFDIALITITLINYARRREVGNTVMIPVVLACVIVSATARILKKVSPRFDNMIAKEAHLKGHLRYLHSRVITNSEEIAFYKGQQVEHNLLKKAFKDLYDQTLYIFKKRIPYVAIEQFLMKYVWSATGMAMIAIPILFTHNTKIDNDPDGGVSERTRGFATAKNLLYSSADAAERLMVSYKEINELAGYTDRVHQMFKVIEEVKNNKFERVGDVEQRGEKYDISKVEGSIIESSGLIETTDMPIVTPNGDVIVNNFNVKIEPGTHVFITGPNGCGKSSFFRVLGGLWPVYSGTLKCPKRNQMFYIPQRPYMTLGTLRNQIIYPDSHAVMKSRGFTDHDLMRILDTVTLGHIVEREGGLSAHSDWMDVLSGGEKQRLGMARVLYHQPLYALLDECTSAVSIDVEGKIYQAIKDVGVTLLTISHRPSLWHFHSHLLKYDGYGGYEFGKMKESDLPSVQNGH
ncbi:unnamed protein product [Bursaphelenchus okinawaensis]|uniref:ABC transporter domain-containing protein n=1 Tax=Bursaphelenchus okinawaensis TaxID=465554 RepID=A0A811K899_9BILA|nr:unnamed protein product [Bursaphelenchus okinawaensis]CAG9095431.1 unnamed protein product [Bursaphelenchus okinawaensis]